MTTDDRLERLELRVMEQQAVIDDLNQAVIGQWKEIEALRLELRRLGDRLAETTAALADGPMPPEPPPPHY